MCKHEKFIGQVGVTRLTDNKDSLIVTGFCADIQIRCAECFQAFEFVGVEAGYSTHEPRVSVDSTELRIPIKPATGQLIFESANTKLN